MASHITAKRRHSELSTPTDLQNTDSLQERTTRATKKGKIINYIQESQVDVEKMAAKAFEGWRIKVDGTSCGTVKFTPKSDTIFNKHVTIDFNIPKPKQGLHIGRIALKKAIDKSSYSFFVAHLRKSNTASKKALSAVGFTATAYPGSKQLCMIFRKAIK